jgi:hypothetical protein
MRGPPRDPARRKPTGEENYIVDMLRRHTFGSLRLLSYDLHCYVFFPMLKQLVAAAMAGVASGGGGERAAPAVFPCGIANFANIDE